MPTSSTFGSYFYILLKQVFFNVHFFVVYLCKNKNNSVNTAYVYVKTASAKIDNLEHNNRMYKIEHKTFGERD